MVVKTAKLDCVGRRQAESLEGREELCNVEQDKSFHRSAKC